VRSLRLAPAVLAEIEREGSRAYPNEGCGALLGPGDGRVTEVLALPNREAEKPRVRFALSPQDYMAVETEAESRGLSLVGFWHSHPDHPARPSATDRQYAWEGLLTLILAVDAGRARELTAWELPGGDRPFQQLPLESSDDDKSVGGERHGG
jgi:proteasome lid subunit RPN8/RPN11